MLTEWRASSKGSPSSGEIKNGKPSRTCCSCWAKTTCICCKHKVPKFTYTTRNFNVQLFNYREKEKEGHLWWKRRGKQRFELQPFSFRECESCEGTKLVGGVELEGDHTILERVRWHVSPSQHSNYLDRVLFQSNVFRRLLVCWEKLIREVYWQWWWSDQWRNATSTPISTPSTPPSVN